MITRIALLASLTLAAAAAAAEPVVVPVATADLDLTRPSDVARLDARLRRAAERSCGSPHKSLSLELSRTHCVAAALVAARRDAATAIAAARTASPVMASR